MPLIIPSPQISLLPEFSDLAFLGLFYDISHHFLPSLLSLFILWSKNVGEKCFAVSYILHNCLYNNLCCIMKCIYHWFLVCSTLVLQSIKWGKQYLVSYSTWKEWDNIWWAVDTRNISLSKHFFQVTFRLHF